jgi:uncharacterized membrane protein
MAEIDGASGRPVSTTMAHIIYAMHAISPFTLWTLSLVAVIVAAFNRDAVRGTYLDSHYSWLLRTFLWGLIWLVVATTVFVITIVGIFLLFIPWAILTIWYLYRVIRGWLRLNDGRPAPGV